MHMFVGIDDTLKYTHRALASIADCFISDAIPMAIFEPHAQTRQVRVLGIKQRRLWAVWSSPNLEPLNCEE
jgi:hypothetical protein